jgi:hypothetical protein
MCYCAELESWIAMRILSPGYWFTANSGRFRNNPGITPNKMMRYTQLFPNASRPLGSPSKVPTAEESDFYTAEEIPIPEGIVLEASALGSGFLQHSASILPQRSADPLWVLQRRGFFRHPLGTRAVLISPVPVSTRSGEAMAEKDPGPMTRVLV